MAKTKSTFKTKTTRGNEAPVNGASATPEIKAVSPEVKAAPQTIAEKQAPKPVSQTPELKRADAPKVETPKLETKKPELQKRETAQAGARFNARFDLHEEIRRRAYELYRQRGFTAGDQTQDWLTAEREVRQKLGPEHHA